MTTQELRKLYDRQASEWTDAELTFVLTERYEPTKVPPCRVCGGELSIGAIGGGSPTRYGCMAENAAHYSESSWEDRRQGGDSTVLELIARFSRHNVKEHAPPPLESEGAATEELHGGCCVSSCSESSFLSDGEVEFVKGKAGILGVNPSEFVELVGKAKHVAEITSKEGCPCNPGQEKSL